MRKTLFTHLFIWCVVLGFAFNVVAQDNSVGKVPMTTEKPTVNYGITNDAPTSVATAYGHAGILGQFVSMPIPAGDPFTQIGAMAAGGFFGSAEFGPDGTYYLIEQVNAELYTVDLATGATTLVGSTGVGLTGLTYDWSTDTFFGVSTTDLYTVDVTTGATTLVGSLGAAGLFIDVAADCDGLLYGYDLTDDNFYSIDPATGAATIIGALGYDANFGQGMSYDHSTGILYLSAFNNGTFTGQLRSVDVATGNTTLVFDWGFEQVAPFAIDQACAGGGLTIAEAIEDLDGDFVPDRLGQTVTVQGVVFSPNFQSTNNSFYIDDGTAGTDIFMFGPPVFTWAMGDELEITGEVAQFNGMTEIIPADSSGWVLVSTGNATPDPIVLTLAQYKADPEAYEGSLVGFISLDLVGGSWPGSGSNANLQFSDGIDTVTFRIDRDTDIDGQPEPIWPRDIIGIGSQFDSNPPYDGGYQIFPRFYATDFLPPGTIPVELTSFTARANDGVVYLDWTTATEQNNQGFEVQRSTTDQFTTIGFVNGYGTTTEIRNYSFTDTDVQPGTYYYRLKQVDYDGTFEYLDVVQVDVATPVNFTLEQNYPNPFNPSTIITFSLAVDSKVSLKVFDVLGQEVTKLITTNMTAGLHEVNFDAVNLNSGVYFYRLDATGVDGTNFTSVKKMILTK